MIYYGFGETNFNNDMTVIGDEETFALKSLG
jgi:hypothetical protein